MTEIVIATRNRHKAGEMLAVLGEVKVRFLTLAEFPSAPEVLEDGKTLEDNALKKAVSAADSTGKWALADDTGLEVGFLNGEPGINSARFAGPGCDYKANNEKLMRALSGVPQEKRTAVFRCVMALVSPDGKKITEEGRMPGMIGLSPRGDNGFGYDPLFIVPGSGKTFAELSFTEKNFISHRALAARKMALHIKKL